RGTPTHLGTSTHAHTLASQLTPPQRPPQHTPRDSRSPLADTPDFSCPPQAGGASRPQEGSDDARGFEQTHNRPGLVTGDRPTFRDFHEVALVVLVGFVVCLVAIRTHHDLAQNGVLDAALDVHHNGLVHLVADNTTDQGALALGRCSSLGFAHFTVLPSQP